MRRYRALDGLDETPFVEFIAVAIQKKARDPLIGIAPGRTSPSFRFAWQSPRSLPEREASGPGPIEASPFASDSIRSFRGPTRDPAGEANAVGTGSAAGPAVSPASLVPPSAVTAAACRARSGWP